MLSVALDSVLGGSAAAAAAAAGSYKCPYCARAQLTEPELIAHVFEKHTNESPRMVCTTFFLLINDVGACLWRESSHDMSAPL